jgi:DNA replication protein DnaC
MQNIIIKDERNYQVISGNAITILNELPASIYELSFIPNEGFSLNETDGYFNITEKLYGQIETITKRVLHTFETVTGNLGVLFSGPKGLGKSLALRNICKEAVRKELPIILVNKHFDNISSFIDTIRQSVVVVFDEFEKHFLDRNKADREDLEGQDSLLNLFDSTLNGKKLFLLSCNDIGNISEYLLNRPGRLHYHFRMHRLSIDEITEYCMDNLDKENSELIPEILSMGALISDFSYDMLRSIIFELNIYKCGLQEARKILNIEARSKSPFNYTIYFQSGKTETGFDYIDTTNKHYRLDWYAKTDGSRNDVMVDMTKLHWTGNNNGSLLLENKHICLFNKEVKDHNNIEKIIFIPAKEGYLDAGNDWDSL